MASTTSVVDENWPETDRDAGRHRRSPLQAGEQAADQRRRQYAENEARRQARLEALLHEAQIAFQNRAFQRAQDLTSSAMQIDPNNAIAYELHTAAVKAGREGRLFGSLKTGDIADAVAAQGLGQIDKRTIELGSAVKSTGRYDATVRLREDVIAALTIDVVAAK